VVMPSYNHEKYVGEAIGSVLNQTMRDFELIIVDDGSIDNSKNIIERCCKKDARIKPIFHNENRGISRTYNDGAKCAKGKFIAFIDSDDLWLDTKLEKQLAVLEKNEDLVVWSEGEIIDGNGVPNGQTFTQIAHSEKKKKNGDIFEELFHSDNFVLDSSIIFKKENLPKKGFDENLKYLNDYRFIVDLSKEKKFCFLEEPLTKYRIHGKNTLFRDGRAWQQDRVVMYRGFLSDYGTLISKKSKANLLFRMGCAYEELGENKLARHSFFGSVRVNPLGKKAMQYFFVALTGMRLMT